MKEAIRNYYNELAGTYDENRFANSYGDYIHRQEIAVLTRYLDKTKTEKNLDLACGTGRFMEYAQYGLDLSPEMVQVSSEKFPSKNVAVGDAESLPFADGYFENVLAFHLFMHLDHPQMSRIFQEVARVTSQGGYFVFDVPSQKRRKLTGYKASNWHGGNQIDTKTLRAMTAANWKLVAYHGIAFFPIHKIPKGLRKLFIGLDNAMSNSPLREWSSHLIFVLRKK